MSSADDFRDNPPPKQGMSSTAKVLIILGSIAGVVLLACCGGVAFVWIQAPNWFKNLAQNVSVTQNPAEVRERTQQMLHIDIPADFMPLQAMEFFVMKWAVYQGKSGPQSLLIIMEMNKEMVDPNGDMDAQQQREQMRQSLRQQQQFGTMEEINEESHETRRFTIDGKTVEFDFTKGKSKTSQTVIHQVVGVIPTAAGIVLIQMTVPDADYNEEAVTAMLKSIRLPANEPDEGGPVEAGQAVEMPVERDSDDNDADNEAEQPQ